MTVFFLDGIMRPAGTWEREMAVEDGYSAACSNSLCYSKGTVSLSSSDPFGNPLVDFKALSDKRDLRNCIEGVKLVRNLFKDKLSNTT